MSFRVARVLATMSAASATPVPMMVQTDARSPSDGDEAQRGQDGNDARALEPQGTVEVASQHRDRCGDVSLGGHVVVAHQGCITNGVHDGLSVGLVYADFAQAR